jgi:hypothetical protein
MLLGVAFVLKLYGGPFLLYFAAKRQWKALAGMAVAAGIGIATATLLFGWGGVSYFALHIFPRAVQGETLDPYNSGNGSLSTLLRRTFVPEAELNAAPVFNTPGLFFFLQPFLVLAILFLPLVSVRDSPEEKQDFAFFCIAVLLASPNVASYTFILLLLPITLLINEAGASERSILVFCYILLTFPMPSGWRWMFPKLWLLVAVFLVVLRRYRGLVDVRLSFAAIGLAAAIAAGTAARREIAYQQEPVRKCERAVTQRGAIYSSSPAVMRSGIVYEAIGRTHYVLQWAHEHRVDEFAFAGEALDPVAVSPNGPIRFRLIAHGASRNMLLDIRNGGTVTALGQGGRWEEQTSTRTAALSPDGRWVAFTGCRGGSEQIWIRRSDGGSPARLTGGDCNNFSPAWELDSRGLIFASDCDRGIGLPGLYRMRLDHVGQR